MAPHTLKLQRLKCFARLGAGRTGSIRTKIG